MVSLLEPGRFRSPRDSMQAEHRFATRGSNEVFPRDTRLRVFVCHMRPEELVGVCRPLDLGLERTLAFGYTNHGGTLDTAGLLTLHESLGE
ncbi:hypothetical protein QPM17_14285 [Marinobacter sp. TBZ242]|uniref:Uncharacterized protein n=1 Tax=Marinobacter azerbaijanicus TaxID=3050455 RepID=A0ABT7IDS8_9GAMM|nr:hypothetical protein [Marinobacter sp. TBZ242]MDL0432309.1 hypothetical protein [Marinobacter sp. TBZ242]